ncbi:MAG: TPM domain-containing protein [Betaproteobacteria bacterium]|nr:TPM domain-containing protein [Betaproteobacteria bacterium]
MKLGRILKHLFAPHWIVARAFPRRTLAAVEAAIQASEKSHDGELRFALEGALHPWPLARGQSARARAIELFSSLRVWDTEHNSGVLIYVQLVDRRIEIIADRGISAKVEQREWDAICRGMEAAFRLRNYEQGALEAIAQATLLLSRHFPAQAGNPNELPDRPVVL